MRFVDFTIHTSGEKVLVNASNVTHAFEDGRATVIRFNAASANGQAAISVRESLIDVGKKLGGA